LTNPEEDYILKIDTQTYLVLIDDIYCFNINYDYTINLSKCKITLHYYFSIIYTKYDNNNINRHNKYFSPIKFKIDEKMVNYLYYMIKNFIIQKEIIIMKNIQKILILQININF